MNSDPACCKNTASWRATALVLKALGHPVRLEMVHRLKLNGDCCCGDLCECFAQSQSTISQHLSVLTDAGIVRRKADGNRSIYSLDRDVLERIESEIKALTSSNLAGVASD